MTTPTPEQAALRRMAQRHRPPPALAPAPVTVWYAYLLLQGASTRFLDQHVPSGTLNLLMQNRASFQDTPEHAIVWRLQQSGWHGYAPEAVEFLVIQLALTPEQAARLGDDTRKPVSFTRVPVRQPLIFPGLVARQLLQEHT